MMISKDIYSFSCRKALRLFLLLFCYLFSVSLSAQEAGNNDEQVKRLQRAIFVFNFSQQVSWQNLDEIKSFKIGVLGPDRTVLDLKSLANKRKIYGKPVEIVRFQLVKDVKDIQVLYVNQKYNYEIQYVLNKVAGKHILLISEDYNFNSSMINMVNVGNSFEYEINANRLRKEGFTFAPSLSKYAITSSQKWKRLYRDTEKSLVAVKEENKEQQSVLKDITKQVENQNEELGVKQQEIKAKQEEISKRNQIIQNLYSESQLQQKKYEEKLLIEQELENNIEQQITFIKSQEEKIRISNLEIQKQTEVLNNQKEEIVQQKNVLKNQAEEINLQKQINILLVSLVAIVLLVSIYIYRSYRLKKRLTKELRQRNQEIREQSLELEQKNSELEQFAYIASHDLQEPLNTISSFIGLISEDYGDSFDEAGKESLSFIQDASVRMKKLIDALLQYSRLGRSKDFTEVDCNKVLDEIQKDLKTVIDRTQSTIHVKKLPKVTGNDIELRLLFQNLISNGMKFMKEGKKPVLHISGIKEKAEEGDKNFIKFSVKDNGIGIPQEHQQRIFSIFQRLHTRDQYKGTGIGLAHCKKIIESHGGEIGLTSKEGEGTTFYFTIPAADTNL